MTKQDLNRLKLGDHCEAAEASSDGVLFHLVENEARTVPSFGTRQIIDTLLIRIGRTKEPAVIAILAGQAVGHALVLAESRLRELAEPMHA